MTSDQPVELRLQLQAEDTDREELDRMTQQLFHELREHPVESVERVREGAAPPGTKAVDQVVAAVAVAVLPKLLPSIIDFVQSWLQRQKIKSLSFTGTLNGHPIDFRGSAQDFDKLIRTLTRPVQPANEKT